MTFEEKLKIDKIVIKRKYNTLVNLLVDRYVGKYSIPVRTEFTKYMVDKTILKYRAEHQIERVIIDFPDVANEDIEIEKNNIKNIIESNPDYSLCLTLEEERDFIREVKPNYQDRERLLPIMVTFFSYKLKPFCTQYMNYYRVFSIPRGIGERAFRDMFYELIIFPINQDNGSLSAEYISQKTSDGVATYIKKENKKTESKIKKIESKHGEIGTTRRLNYDRQKYVTKCSNAVKYKGKKKKSKGRGKKRK